MCFKVNFRDAGKEAHGNESCFCLLSWQTRHKMRIPVLGMSIWYNPALHGLIQKTQLHKDDVKAKPTGNIPEVLTWATDIME